MKLDLPHTYHKVANHLLMHVSDELLDINALNQADIFKGATWELTEESN